MNVDVCRSKVGSEKVGSLGANHVLAGTVPLCRHFNLGYSESRRVFGIYSGRKTSSWVPFGPNATPRFKFEVIIVGEGFYQSLFEKPD